MNVEKSHKSAVYSSILALFYKPEMTKTLQLETVIIEVSTVQT